MRLKERDRSARLPVLMVGRLLREQEEPAVLSCCELLCLSCLKDKLLAVLADLFTLLNSSVVYSNIISICDKPVSVCEVCSPKDFCVGN